MKIHIVSTSVKTRGGISEVVKSILSGFNKQAIRYKVYSTHLDRRNVLKIFLFFFALSKLVIGVKKNDIVYLHVGDYISMWRKLLIIRFLSFKKFKTVLHIHVPLENCNLESRHEEVLSRLIVNSSLVIVLSKSLEAVLAEKFPNQKFITLYNPARMRVINNKNERNWILWAGTLNRRKNYELMLKSFAKIADEYPEWTLYFAGNGDLNRAKRIAGRLGIEGRVEFLGWINGETKNRFFEASKVYCLTSDSEGLPMSILDACVAECAIVSTRVGTLCELPISEKELLMVRPGDELGLASALSKILNDRSLLSLMSEGSRNLSRTLFSEERYQGKLLELLQNLDEGKL